MRKNMLIMFIYRAKYVWDAVQRMHACLTFLNWPRTSLNRHVSTHIYVPHVANVYKQCCYLIHVAVHIHKRFLNMVVHLYHHDTSYYRGIRLVTWIVDNKDIVTYHWSVNTQLHHCYICPLRPATQVHAGRCASSKHNPCSCVHIWQSAHIPSCIPVYNGGPVPHTTRRIGSKDPSSFYGVEAIHPHTTSAPFCSQIMEILGLVDVPAYVLVAAMVGILTYMWVFCYHQG